MALCRLLLYLTAASAAVQGTKGLALWSALALAAYVVGLSYIARKESMRGPVRFWPAGLLGTPILLAWFVNSGEYKMRGILFSILLIIWIVRCLSDIYWTATANIGRTVSGLLAGICLVDLLAVAGGGTLAGLAFILFFATALLCQRLVPAT
jgi:4-hydroxybenzoate polyprenyltransferase